VYTTFTDCIHVAGTSSEVFGSGFLRLQVTKHPSLQKIEAPEEKMQFIYNNVVKGNPAEQAWALLARLLRVFNVSRWSLRSNKEKQKN
jgi:hypothetical protein